MHFYLASSSLLPAMLRLRLLALCLTAGHLPLLAYLVWGRATGRFAWAEGLVLLLGAVAGSAGALRGVAALLEPLDRSADPARTEGVAVEDNRLGRMVESARRWIRSGRGATGAPLSQEDALTGLPSQRALLKQLQALPPIRREGCIAILDMDHLAVLKAVAGGEQADHIVSGFADRLSAQIRRSDMIGRWGAEGFAIFYQDAIEDEASWSLARFAERLRREPLDLVDGQPIGFSAGLCRWRHGPIEGAIVQAEEALAQAKASGRGQIQRAGRVVASAYG